MAVRPGDVPVNWKAIATMLGVVVALLTIFGFVSAFGRGDGERDARIDQHEKSIIHNAQRLDGVGTDLSELKAGLRVLDERTLRMERDIQEVKKAVSR